MEIPNKKIIPRMEIRQENLCDSTDKKSQYITRNILPKDFFSKYLHILVSHRYTQRSYRNTCSQKCNFVQANFILPNYSKPKSVGN